jgi:hypothetical protein
MPGQLPPHRLLAAPVEDWLIAHHEPFHRRLGAYYPVVVRSLDRLRTPALPLRQQWRAKWRWLQEHSMSHPELAVRWVSDEDGDDPQRFYRELGGDQPVCVAWPGSPPPGHLAPDSVLGAAIWAGVPVAIWCRGNGSDHDNHRQMAELLSATPLPQLPDAVRQLRTSADGDECGSHIALVWDDPRRLPAPRLGLSGTGGEVDFADL